MIIMKNDNTIDITYFWDAPEEDIIEIINQVDKELASFNDTEEIFIRVHVEDMSVSLFIYFMKMIQKKNIKIGVKQTTYDMIKRKSDRATEATNHTIFDIDKFYVF